MSKDIDLERETLLIRDSKFGKSRIVPFGPRLAARLRTYLAPREQRLGPARPEAPLFSWQGRAPVHPNSIRRALREHLLPRSYRDTLRLFLQFVGDDTRRTVSRLTPEDLTVDRVALGKPYQCTQGLGVKEVRQPATRLTSRVCSNWRSCQLILIDEPLEKTARAT